MKQVKVLNKNYNASINCVDKIVIIDFDTDAEFLNLLNKVKSIVRNNNGIMADYKAPERGIEKNYIAFMLNQLPEAIRNQLQISY